VDNKELLEQLSKLSTSLQVDGVDHKVWRPVNYTSRAKTEAEMAYGKVDGESLGVLSGILSNTPNPAIYCVFLSHNHTSVSDSRFDVKSIITVVRQLYINTDSEDKYSQEFLRKKKLVTQIKDPLVLSSASLPTRGEELTYTALPLCPPDPSCSSSRESWSREGRIGQDSELQNSISSGLGGLSIRG
jgi:hypothetical protein